MHRPSWAVRVLTLQMSFVSPVRPYRTKRHCPFFMGVLWATPRTRVHKSNVPLLILLLTFLEAWFLIRELRPPVFVRSLAPDELGLDCVLLPFRSIVWLPANKSALPYRMVRLSVARAFGTAHLPLTGPRSLPRCSLIEEPHFDELSPGSANTSSLRRDSYV